MSQIVNIFIFAGSVATILLCGCSVKAKDKTKQTRMTGVR